MQRFEVGDRVKIDIPDQTDPDYEACHGKHGTVTDVLTDNADLTTGDSRDSTSYRIKLDESETADFRWRDLRPASKR